MAAEAFAFERDDTRHEDHRVVLRGLGWDDYERLLETRGERSSPRITYLEGLIEIMSPARIHEKIKSIVGRLIEVYCLENDVEFATYGSWTIKDKTVERGAEPDECYVFSDAADPERPDLVIEVIWTSGGIDKLDVYRKLRVREVWFWRKGRLTPWVLVDDVYEERSSSEVLPGIDLVLLASFLDRPTTSGAIRAYRDALRAR